MVSIAIVLAVLIGLHLLRRHHATRPLERIFSAPFEGEILRSGRATIGVSRGASPKRSFVCMPGFLEDARYFLDVHGGHGDELILLNSADYHCPFDGTSRETDWGPNPHEAGTIGYDAWVLAHAVRDLATTDQIIVHGHSRGGAVVLDAARQFPEIMRAPGRRIAALLEAPVLPGGTNTGGNPGPVLRALMKWGMPLVFAAQRRISRARLEALPMMRPTNERKTDYLLSIFANTKNYGICVTNVDDILDWEDRHTAELYDGYARVAVLVGERDDVLDIRTMTASAERGAERNPGVRVIQTSATNHFVSLETPEAVHAAVAGLTEAQAVA